MCACVLLVFELAQGAQTAAASGCQPRGRIRNAKPREDACLLSSSCSLTLSCSTLAPSPSLSLFFSCSRQIPRNLIYIFYLIFLNISLAVYVHQSVTKTHASTNKAPADTVASCGYLPLTSPSPPPLLSCTFSYNLGTSTLAIACHFFSYSASF